MSSEQRRLPRLRTTDAMVLAEKLAEDPGSVSPTTHHPNQIYAPLGGPRIEESALQLARNSVLQAVSSARVQHDSAESCEGISWQTRFDVHVGRALHESLELSRSEAAAQGVWSWLTLVLLPDVVLHRYPKPQTSRLLGGLRNVFSVTWWPVEVLGDLVEPESGRALQVDEIVGLFERRTLSRDNELARSYARTVRSLTTRDRMNTSREFAKAVRRVGAHTCWAIADHGRLESLLEEAIERASSIPPVKEGGSDDGPMIAVVRAGPLELPIEMERSDADLQPTGRVDWTAVSCPATVGNPELVRIGEHVVRLEANGKTRRGHARFSGSTRLSNGVVARATVIRRETDLYLKCKLS